MKEIRLAKATTVENEDAVNSVIIRIEDNLPNIFEFRDLYDSNSFFKDQAQRLADSLYDSLPIATLRELVVILTKQLYNLTE